MAKMNWWKWVLVLWITSPLWTLGPLYVWFEVRYKRLNRRHTKPAWEWWKDPTWQREDVH